ncbi:MAG: hypothetical protein ACO1OB_32930 [Archangium sp.]
MKRNVLVVVGAVLLSLVSCCGLCAVSGLVADAPGGGSSELNGRYECQMPGTVMMNGMVMTQYQPTGMWFVIDGDAYTSSGPGGSVSADAQVVSFTGGGYDGWRGARMNDAIVFRNDTANPQPGQGVRFTELRCGRVR